MRKIVIIPDSFKGTLSSVQVCDIVSASAKKVWHGCETVCIPVADGGEGTVECFLRAVGGERVTVSVAGPFGQPTDAVYGIHDKTAFIETASCAGLPLVEGRADPWLTTTFGVGQQIADAVMRGCDRVILGLGGSCTNDCGCGMAAALGAVFYDANGDKFVPTGGTLSDITKIDTSGMIPAGQIEITAMCDIDNPLYGQNGAAYVFAPQKGADADTVKLLDDGLRHVSEIIKRDINADVAFLPGAGAAGGMGAGCAAFLGAKLCSGIETVLDTVGFDRLIADADIVITGEGKFDFQSLSGKAVIGVARRAKKQNVPVIVIAGGCEGDLTAAYDEGITSVFTINRLPEPLEVSAPKSAQNLALTADAVMRTLGISWKRGD